MWLPPDKQRADPKVCPQLISKPGQLLGDCGVQWERGFLEGSQAGQPNGLLEEKSRDCPRMGPEVRMGPDPVPRAFPSGV